MAAFDTLHNELRLRVPDKSYEFYNDAIRWAIDTICVKTSCWQVRDDITTEADKDTYRLMLPAFAVIHSVLYIIQHSGNYARKVSRPVNGMDPSWTSASDYLQSFKAQRPDSVQIFPTPKDGSEKLTVVLAVKPTTMADTSDFDPFFSEYKDTVVYGALFRLKELGGDFKEAEYFNQKFKEGVSSVHVDTLKENAETPLRISSRW